MSHDEITSEQFWLRPMRLQDVRAAAVWWEEVADLGMFHRRMPVPLSVDSLEAVWRELLAAPEPRTSYWFTLTDREGIAIGIAGIEDVNYTHGNAITPVFLSAAARGKGLGLRVRGILLDLAFDQLALHRIVSYHRADNIASRRVNEKCGLREEGRMREAWRAGPDYVDLMVFGVLADEWRQLRTQLRESLSAGVVVTLGSDPTGDYSWPAAASGHDCP